MMLKDLTTSLDAQHDGRQGVRAHDPTLLPWQESMSVSLMLACLLMRWEHRGR